MLPDVNPDNGDMAEKRILIDRRNNFENLRRRIKALRMAGKSELALLPD